MTETSSEFVAEQLELNKRRRILHPILRAILSLLCKTEVSGLEHIPSEGSVMMISNHISIIDPVLYTLTIPNRYVIAMAKSESLDNLIESLAIRIWGNFVVNRGEVDREALNHAIDLLKAGQALWIAAEGSRHPQGMSEAKGGSAYIAYKADARVIPCAICNVQGWGNRLKHFQRVPAKLFFGQPFKFVLPEGERLSREVRDMMIQEAMYQVALLMPEEFAFQRGFYSDIEKATTKYLQFCD